MESTYRIDGMHCTGCVGRVTRALQAIADEVHVTLDPPQAVIDADPAPSLEQVRAAVAAAGKYTVEAES